MKAESVCQGAVNRRVPEDGRLKSRSVLTAGNYSQHSQGGIFFLQATPPAPLQLPGKQPSPLEGRALPQDHEPGQEGQRGENHRPKEESALRDPARSEGRDT